jgi:hypothetical protein
MGGIPAHVWDLSTAEQLLAPYCWVEAVHPDTAERADMSRYNLTAWTAHPEPIHRGKDLLVMEPFNADEPTTKLVRGPKAAFRFIAGLASPGGGGARPVS